ncbi:MAG: MATE family efflux transporter [Pseudomonadota bacterium]
MSAPSNQKASGAASGAEDQAAVQQKEKPRAAFTTGSTMRHVLVMTATSSIGLVSIFLVDAINLFYIALLGQQELAAAIGYAATIMFFSISICIGISIASAALVGRALGAGEDERARELSTLSLVYLLISTTLLAAALYPSLDTLLGWLGAEGETQALAVDFMQIVVPSIPLLGLGMCLGALLRAKGDPRRAMFVTLSGGAAAIVLDPILIFGLGLELTGAAIATVLVRVVLVIVGLWGVHTVHRMLGPVSKKTAVSALRPFFAIALPAVVTQLATPVGNAYVTAAIAEFGDDAVAGWAIVGRLLPVAFGVIFALSGSVGPIVSQNYGAKLFGRVRSTMRDALTFTLIYCLVIWAILAALSSTLVSIFGATGDAATLVTVFCWLVAGSFLFNGALFVANAGFNNLGHPVYATVFNWGRATLGVVPFVWVGKAYGPEGVLIGWGLGAIVFGIGSAIVAFHVIAKLSDADGTDGHTGEPMPKPLPGSAAAASPFSSGKTVSLD